jgi:hypothetical protein
MTTSSTICSRRRTWINSTRSCLFVSWWRTWCCKCLGG